MNTVEKIYHNAQVLSEFHALEVLHFSEFLKSKEQEKIPNEITVAAIEAGERGEYEAVSLDDLKKQWDEA